LGNTPKPKRRDRVTRPRPTTASGRPPWVKWLVGGGIGVALVLLVVFISADVTQNPQGQADPPPGTQTFFNTENTHTTGPVQYEQDPPTGGPHEPQWLTCAAYDEPVRNESAVHALEHGAVWITYRPDLSEDDIDTLEGFARRSEVIVSPYPGLDTAVAASAWNRQLKMDEVDRDLIDQFIRAFQNRTAPETAAGC